MPNQARWKAAAAGLLLGTGPEPSQVYGNINGELGFHERKPWEPTLAKLFPTIGTKKRKKK